MRTLIHISDLHFGRTDPALEEKLKAMILARKPDLIIVSGDLTQRATRKQFLEAELFFSSLPFPLLVVPGNHDVPLYSFWKRFSFPYKNFKRYISDDLEPEYLDDEMAVVGINTVRILRMVEGSVSQLQTKRVHNMFDHVGKEVFRIVVSHHPFNIPKGHYKPPMAKVKKFWHSIDEVAKVDLFLSGHLHDTFIHREDPVYKVANKGSLIVQAGTAISTRRRKEGNVFNVITLDYPNISIERYMTENGNFDFSLIKTDKFVKTSEGWQRIKENK